MYVIRMRCSEAKETEARGFNLGCLVSRIIVDTKRWHASYYSHRGQQPCISRRSLKGYVCVRDTMYACMYTCIICVYVCVCCCPVKHFLISDNTEILCFMALESIGIYLRRYYTLYILVYIYIYARVCVYLCVFSLRIVGMLVAYSNFGPRLYYLQI